MLQSGRTDALESLLDRNVEWQGVLPYQMCHNRREVLHILSGSGGRAPRLTRIEAEEVGDQVVVSVEGPDFPDNDALPAAAPRSLVFTFDNGVIVRMQSLPNRDAAFDLAARARA